MDMGVKLLLIMAMEYGYHGIFDMAHLLNGP
jgi:hypothetical protein